MKRVVLLLFVFVYGISLYSKDYDIKKEIGIDLNLSKDKFLKLLDKKEKSYTIDTIISGDSTKYSIAVLFLNVFGVEPLQTYFVFYKNKIETIKFDMKPIPRIELIHKDWRENATNLYECDGEDILYDKCETISLKKCSIRYVYSSRRETINHKVTITFY